jgi:hypothetical protein
MKHGMGIITQTFNSQETGAWLCFAAFYFANTLQHTKNNYSSEGENHLSVSLTSPDTDFQLRAI